MNRQKYYFLFILIPILVIVVISSLKTYYVSSFLYIEIKGPSQNTYQIYYNIGRGINEYDSLKLIVNEEEFITFRCEIPAKKIRMLRVDPGIKEGTVYIRQFFIENVNGKNRYTPLELFQNVVRSSDIKNMYIKNDLLVIQTKGQDPQILFDINFYNKSNAETIRIKKIRLYIFSLLFSVSLFTIFILLKIVFKFNSKKYPTTPFDLFIQYRFIIALFLFIILVAGKFHGSSISIWDRHIRVKTDNYRGCIVIGVGRPVRSDEYLVQTPMFFSQTMTNNFFPARNPYIRSDGQNMLFPVYAPVLDISLIGKPFVWGFILFGKEYGLSWFWWSKLFLLFLASFELSLFLTKGNKYLSLIGAFWISFSPGIQWWFSTGLIDLIIFAQALIIVIWYYSRGVTKRCRILLMIITTISGTGFVLTIYPPFQIPLALLITLFTAGIIYTNRSKISFSTYDYIIFSIVMIITSVSILSYVIKSFEPINILRQTVYPGNRNSKGGNYDIRYLQLYLVNWLLPYKNVNFSNSSEVSTFLNFLPAVFLGLFKVYKIQKRKLLFSILCALILFQFLWLVIRFPSRLSKIFLLSYVPEQRMQLILSLTAVYLSIWVFSTLVEKHPFSWYESLLITISVAFLYYFSIKNTHMEQYLGSQYIFVFTILLFFGLNYSFIKGMRRAFSLLLLIFIMISGLPVNPFSRGIDPIYRKVVSQKILEIKNESPLAKWAATNSLVLGNLLIALGVKSFNSVHIYPDLPMWKILDPDGRYNNVYNRYAHVGMELVEGPTMFELIQPDYFIVKLSVHDLEKTGIKYIVSYGKIGINTQKLYLIDKVEYDNLYIYEVNS